MAESTLELGQVMMACENIYQRCMSKTHVARKEVKDSGSGDLDDTAAVVEKLNAIRDYITDLQSISKGFVPKAAAPKGELGAPAPPADAAAAGGGASGAKAVGADTKKAADGRQSVRGATDSKSRHSMSTGSEQDTAR